MDQSNQTNDPAVNDSAPQVPAQPSAVPDTTVDNLQPPILTSSESQDSSSVDVDNAQTPPVTGDSQSQTPAFGSSPQTPQTDQNEANSVAGPSVEPWPGPDASDPTPQPPQTSPELTPDSADPSVSPPLENGDDQSKAL